MTSDTNFNLGDEGGVEDPISVDGKYATGGVVGEGPFDPTDFDCGYVIHPDTLKEIRCPVISTST